MMDSHDLSVEAEITEPFTVEELENHQGSAPADPPTDMKGRTRKRGLIIVAILLVLSAVGYLAYRMMAPSAEETDDAYVGGDIVSITSREGGTVLAIHAVSTTEQNPASVAE